MYSFKEYTDPEAHPWIRWVENSFYIAKSWSVSENVKVLPEIIMKQIDKHLLIVCQHFYDLARVKKYGLN